MMDENDMDGLTSFFEQLQKDEMERMLDFVDMELENDRQMKLYK